MAVNSAFNGFIITQFRTRQCVNDRIKRMHQHKLCMAFVGQLLGVAQPVGGFSRREIAHVDNFLEGKASGRLLLIFEGTYLLVFHSLLGVFRLATFG